MADIMTGINSIIGNMYLWMGLTFLFLILFILCFIFIILLAKKTHAVVEFKAWMKGRPIALYFLQNRYVDWVVEEPDAGIITNKNYGCFVVSPLAAYIDKKTKSVLLPFDTDLAMGINIQAAKAADDLQYILKDEEKLKQFRYLLSTNQLEITPMIDALRTNVYLGAIKYMMNAMIPHNINAKIEKMVAARIKNYGQVNGMQLLLIFGGVLGAIIVGYMLLKITAKN
jgi:hypothetical protein